MNKVIFGLIFVPLLYCTTVSTRDEANKLTFRQKTTFKKTESDNLPELRNWLAITSSKRPALKSLPFAKQALTKEQAKKATTLLLEDKQKTITKEYGNQWDARLLKYKDYKMPFYYHIFGQKPKDGRSLFISLHGGGQAASFINDSQYRNQQHLYDRAIVGNNIEGVYLAPRAPTNTWDLWQQSQIDDFLNIIIQMAVIKEGVNPNKVYILGYSAGGDGLYQLAPRMADRWAAAAMMAGHPGDASALSLRNIPFYIQVGALDAAYNRNDLAKKWGKILDSLQRNDPKGYIHQVKVREGFGHWMNLQDAVALPWTQKYRRNPIPKKIVWVQDNRYHSSFYWIGTPKNSIAKGGKIIAEYNTEKNEVNIKHNYNDKIKLFLNDQMLDLDRPVAIKYQDKLLYKGLLCRSILNIYNSLKTKGDINLTFPSLVIIRNGKVVRQKNCIQ